MNKNQSLGESTDASILHTYLAAMHHKYAKLDTGALADYIPELSKANPDWFGIALVTVDGHVYTVGDTGIQFTIQSISKPFTLGLALEDKGVEFLRSKVNVEPSGEAFNRISLEHNTGRPRNAMINAGAIATVCQVGGGNGAERFARIIAKYSLLAGTRLQLDEDVFQSEKSTGHRNRAIAHMLLNAGIIEGDPEEVLEAYFKQCSVLVTCRDLAVMGATLANHGVNPLTGVQALDKHHVPKILSVMSSCGMYDGSGTWSYDIGLPAKSGVGGGIMAVLPGKFAIAVFSPRLDPHGNSVRGIQVCQSFSDELGLHIFNSDRLSTLTVIRSSYTIDQVPSKRNRSKKASAILATQGKKARVYELTGELGFSAAEVILSRVEQDLAHHDMILIGMRRVTSADQAAARLFAGMAHALSRQGKRLILSDTHAHADFVTLLGEILKSPENEPPVQAFDDIDRATEWCENHYLSQSGVSSVIRTTFLSQQELLSGLNSDDLDFLLSAGKETTYAKGDYLCRAGDSGAQLFFILSGYVSITIPLESGRQQRLATFDAGSAIGEFSVVDKRPRSADVIANTAVTCLVVDFEKIEQDPSEQARRVRATVIENLARGLVERLRKANAEVRALSI